MSKKRILYVDDEQINLLLFEANFKNAFEVITAENGMSALEKIKENERFDIIISDMRMPIMNGIEFIKAAKTILPDVRYYILTGYGITDEISEALSSGLILKKFNKPFNMEEIFMEMNQ